MRTLLHKAFLLSAFLAPSAQATNWTFSNNYGTMKSTDTESVYGVTVNSDLSRPSTGFLKKVVKTSTGSFAPTVGTNIFSLEVPGLFLVQPPTLTANEGPMIYSAVSGTCPTADSSGIMLFSQWNSLATNDTSQAWQPVFGTFTWNNATRTSTITNLYNVTSFAPVSGFSSFSIAFNACSGGAMVSPGAGDRGGTLYMTGEGGAYFRTNANHGVVVVPQIPVTSQNMLYGNYAVYRHDGLNTTTVKNMRVSISAMGSSFSGNALTDPDAGTTDGTYTDTFTITAINSPVNGMVTGTLQHNALTPVNLACSTYLTSRNVLFCAGQSPDLTSKPLNLMLVSDSVTFNANNATTNDFAPLDAKVIIKDGSGKFYIGGDWYTVGNNITSPGLVRFNSDGTLDTGFLPPGTGLDWGAIVMTAVFGVTGGTDLGKIYVGGNFNNFNGTAAYRVARLNTDYTLDTGFAQTGTGIHGVTNTNGNGWQVNVNSIVLGTQAGDLGKLYVGGMFNQYNATNQAHLVRLNTTGALDTTWKPAGAGFDTLDGSQVRTIAIGVTSGTDLGKIYAGGSFQTFDGVAHNNMLRLLTTGAIDTNFALTGTGFNGDVVKILVDGNKLYVGGNFDQYDGNAVGHLVRLNLDGSLDTGFTLTGSGFDDVVKDLISDGSSGVYVGGDFATFNGSAKNGIARITSTGALSTVYDSGIGAKDDGYCCSQGKVNGMLLDSGASKLYLVGHMSSYKTYPVRRVMRTDLSGNLDNWIVGGGADGCPYNTPASILVDSRDRIIFTGPQFYRGYEINGIARLNTSGTLDGSFNAGGTGFNGEVDGAIYDSSGRIVVYGSFSSYNGVSRSKIARLSADGVLDTTFNNTGTGFNDFVLGVAEDPSSHKLVVGGWFTSYNGTAVSHVARLNTDGTLDTTFNSGGAGADGRVWAVAMDSSSRAYLGGEFDNYNGVSSRGLVRLSSTGARDAAFNVGTGFTHAAGTPWIGALKIYGTAIYVGGTFDQYNGASKNNLTRLSMSNGSVDAGFTADHEPDGDTYSLSLDSTNRIYVAGYNYNPDGVMANTYNVLRYSSTGTLDTAWDAGFGEGAYLWGTTVDSLGNVYVTGTMGHFQGAPAHCITRLDPTTGHPN